MIQWTQFAIVAGAAIVVAIAVRVVRARLAERRRPTRHVHGALMKRAEAFADQSPFLRNVCREFRANGHISDRQAEAVRRAVARFEAR